jgi:hypothetical protein
VLFGFELATLGWLALFMRRWQLPVAALAVYWWNPHRRFLRVYD